ncbi:DMT family transporter [Dyadobacter fanqingshengii]|uniref:DMT family transporter n=1 Tax=Dyadobacter fanqingshengii TaxID=2906443 RepID=A0A9X1TF51_9BACT|nr:DMT family transporter [Dyadobacter fanqingshengii]MCF0039172.1 DMT family transporter [Dyadobacter fanqingshengii]MCF2503287.1 DMT family transporter [Dyadobacter fanqingshengii]USJ34009.1 DMT family transporter [Dyadobacter fanqingshengii]
MFSPTALRSYLHLHFLVLIWGFTAIVGLMVTISPVALVFYRTLFAALGLGAIIFFKNKQFKADNKDIIRMLAVGFILSAHWMLFFASARVSTASVCLAGMATTSLWTSLIEPLVNKRSVRPLEVGLGILAFAGLYVVFKFEFDHALGLMLALASALLAAMFTVANSRLVQRIDAYVITFFEMIGATFFSLIFVVIFEWQGWSKGEPYIPATGDWIWILFLAFICTVYASTMATQLMKQFSAYLINLTINLEPVYGIALAFFFFGEKERMTSEFYMGTLLILLAVLLYPLLINTVLGKKGTLTEK